MLMVVYRSVVTPLDMHIKVNAIEACSKINSTFLIGINIDFISKLRDSENMSNSCVN